MAAFFTGGNARAAIGCALVGILYSRTAFCRQRPLQSPTTSIDEVRQVLRSQSRRLISLKADFCSWQRKNLGTSRYEHYIVAAKANRRYVHLWHGEYRRPQDDPRASIQILDGENWNVFAPFFRRCDVSRKFAVAPYTDKVLLQPLFESLGWWPPDDPSPPARPVARRFFLSDVLASAQCQCLGRELVDGAWCQVVEVPGGRLWVDCSRGVVPRRVLYAAGDDRRTIILFESKDFRPVAPGVLLPYRLRRVLFPLGFDFVSIVNRYEVNDVRDALFHIDAPPGTVFWDRDTDLQSQVPGGFVVMHRLIAWEKSETEPRPRQARGDIVLFSIVGVSIGLGAFRLARTLSRLVTTIRPAPWRRS